MNENDMSYRQYIADAIRTEADYATFEKKLQDDEVLVAFLYALKDFSKAAARLDALKKTLIYGKTLATEDTVETRAMFTPGFDQIRARLAFPPYRRLLHAILGIATEGGELVDALQVFFKTGEFDFKNLLEESGDCKWYGAILDDVICDYLNSNNPEQVFRANIAKLKARYPEKFTEAAALHRDLEAEAKTLEEPKP